MHLDGTEHKVYFGAYCSLISDSDLDRIVKKITDLFPIVVKKCQCMDICNQEEFMFREKESGYLYKEWILQVFCHTADLFCTAGLTLSHLLMHCGTLTLITS